MARSAHDRPRLSAQMADATDHAGLVRLLRGADCLVNCVQYYFNLPVMQAALEARVPYVDLGGFFYTTRKQLELDAAFREAGVTALLCMGSAPGLPNIQARYAADRLNRVHAINIYDGITPTDDGTIAWGYSLDTVLDEMTTPPVVFREGEFHELPLFAEPEEFTFLDPVGREDLHHSIHSEVATLPVSFHDKGVREVSYKINRFGFSRRAFERLRTLTELGLADKHPLTVKGLSVRPRDVLAAVLTAQPKPAPVEQEAILSHEDVTTIVRGDAEQDGREVVYRLSCLAASHPRWGVDAGAVLTAMPLSVAAQWLAQRRISRAGVFPPELIIEPEPFFAALAARGIKTYVTVRERLAA